MVIGNKKIKILRDLPHILPVHVQELIKYDLLDGDTMSYPDSSTRNIY